MVDELQRQGIALHAITAEPGGEIAIRNRLTKYGLPELKFPIYSDPSWSLMALEQKDEIFMENPSHPFLLKAGAFDEEYKMVQPALVIIDRAGKIVYWWSWKKLRAGIVSEDGVLPNARSKGNLDGNTHDVRWRPVPMDLLSRLITPGSDLETLRVENLGFPVGKDHQNVKRKLQRDPAEHRRQQQARGEATDIHVSQGSGSPSSGRNSKL